MWRRKGFLGAMALAMLVSHVAVHAAGFRPKGLTMLVVPARYSVLQVAFDILQKRDAVLVSYQGDATTAEPLLHAWDGKEWVYVPLEKYASAGFLEGITPSQVVLVGDESLLPPALIDASAWCPQFMIVPSIDTATLVNSFGQHFSFRRGDWQWFAGRYNLNLSDLNDERRRSSWYDQPYDAKEETTPARKSDQWREEPDAAPPAMVIESGGEPASSKPSESPSGVIEGPVSLTPSAAVPAADKATPAVPAEHHEIPPAEVVTSP